MPGAAVRTLPRMMQGTPQVSWGGSARKPGNPADEVELHERAGGLPGCAGAFPE